jgi:glycolate oxidase iron-sulfur subunit
MVARGRIWLARQFVEGKLDASATLRLYSDSCLGCRACRAVCPPKIRVDELVFEIKQAILKKLGRNLQDKMVLQACSHPQSFRYLIKMLDLSRRMGGSILLPGKLRDRIGMFPPQPDQTFTDWVRQRGKSDSASGPKVGYFPGCLTDSIFPGIGKAVVEVLNHLGLRVIIPPETTCCGQPHKTAGDFGEAKRLAATTMEFFLGQGVDYIVTSCGSCGHSLKEYAADFREDGLRERAESFAGRCRDIMEFLVDVTGLSFGPAHLPGLRVSYHDSCHLNRALGVAGQPRKLLAGLPGARYVEMVRSDWCCGAAGSYSFKHPGLAQKILAQKTEDARGAMPDIVTAGCPSCIMQLRYGSILFDGGYDVCHPVELLARTFSQGEKQARHQ